MAEETIEPSSGNVFADLNLENPEELLAKAQLAHEISCTAKRLKLSRRATASRLDLDEITVTSLLRGDLARFSIDQLKSFLTILR